MPKVIHLTMMAVMDSMLAFSQIQSLRKSRLKSEIPCALGSHDGIFFTDVEQGTKAHGQLAVRNQ